MLMSSTLQERMADVPPLRQTGAKLCGRISCRLPTQQCLQGALFVSGIQDVCFVDCVYEFSQHQRGSRLGPGVSAKHVMHATLKTLCLQSLDMNELFVTDIMECNALQELEF
jgi:hypothetical protein